MNSNRPVIVKRLTQSQVLRRSQLVQESLTESVEQPEAVVHFESLAELPIDQSVYGSGWSVAELMNEFSGRYDG